MDFTPRGQPVTNLTNFTISFLFEETFSLSRKSKLEKNIIPSPVLVTGNVIQSMHITMILMMIVSKMMMILTMITRIIKLRMII